MPRAQGGKPCREVGPGALRLADGPEARHNVIAVCDQERLTRPHVS